MSLLKDFYRLISIEKTGGQALAATLELNAAHPIFKGHFPGIPVVPGVCMVQMTKELLESVLGKNTRLTVSRSIKFLHVINPLEHTTVVLRLDFKEETAGGFEANSSIASEDGGLVFFKMRGRFEGRDEG